MKERLDNLKKVRDRMKQRKTSSLANKFGSRAVICDVNGSRVVRGTMFKMIDDVKCFMKFQFN